MERLWAPWRMEYIRKSEEEGCVFCIGTDPSEDREKFVLCRTPHSFVIMNRYPYSNAHLMVAPYRHTADLNELGDDEMLDIFRTLTLCKNILQETVRPDGFNIGINLGRDAGAGVDDHLHIHIVPRWHGDINFMTVVADLRVIPESLRSTYDTLLHPFSSRCAGGPA